MSLEERIIQILQKKETTQLQSTSQNSRMTITPTSYKCQECKDTTWLQGEDGMIRCECYKKEQTLKLWANAGLTTDLKTRTFATYKPYNSDTTKAKSIAATFARDFEEKQSSIAFIGQPGSGKTHLGMAIMLNFLEKGIQTVYMSYREEITKLKQNIMDEVVYQREIDKFKRCKVLFIDDLFKGKVTDSDVKIMFEIINHRYINGRTVIVSSELTIDKLLDVDEATGSRVYEMCREYLVEMRGKENNYRMRRI